MPHPDMPGMKQKGRLYVCDLAGTEPAGDIVYARYEKKVRFARSTYLPMQRSIHGRDNSVHIPGGRSSGETCIEIVQNGCILALRRNTSAATI